MEARIGGKEAKGMVKEKVLDFPLLEYDWSNWSEFVDDSYHKRINKPICGRDEGNET